MAAQGGAELVARIAAGGEAGGGTRIAPTSTSNTFVSRILVGFLSRPLLLIYFAAAMLDGCEICEGIV